MGLLKTDTHSNTYPANNTHSPVGGFNAILDRGSEFEGKLTFEGTVRIDGKFKGEIVSDAKLVVGEAGKIDANISVDSISISGQVTGDIKAKTKVEIHAPAIVRGNIEAASLIIEEGAIFEGSCSMEKLVNKNANTNTNTINTLKGPKEIQA